jgi:8-oxo-dGTP pyrophosphatase MutT (NUDIX family)
MTEIVDCLQVLVLNQPAGHVEPEESALEAVQRETLEETGWQVNLEGQALQAATPAASRSPNRSTGIGML